MARKHTGTPTATGPDRSGRCSTARHRLGRRAYLKYGTVATLGVASVGVISGTAVSAIAAPFGIDFDQELDAVDDLGMDPTGEEAIDAPLADAYGTGTLITFPPGEYTVETDAPMGHQVSASRFGILGLGSSHRDVTFRFPDYDGSHGYRFVHQRGGTECILANFSLDQTADHTTNVDVWFSPNDGGIIEDIEWLGFIPNDHYSTGQVLVCHPDSRYGATHDGVNTIRRVTMGKGGSSLVGHPVGSTGIRFYPSFVGETILEDCHLEQLGGNGVRSSAGEGVVTVRGGLYKNNQLTNLRFQGGHHPTKRSSIVGTRVVVDHADADRPTDGAGFSSANAITVEATNGGSDLLIEDTDIICRSIDPDANRNEVVQLNAVGNSNPGGFTMRNCRLFNQTGMTTFHAYHVKDGAEAPLGVTLEDVAITVEAQAQDATAVVVIEDGRDGSSIRNSCIHAPNGAIDGVRFVNCEDGEVHDSTVNVGGTPVVAENATVDTANVSHDGTCDLPSFGGLDHHLRLIADPAADPFEYGFTVEGAIEYVTEGAYPANPAEEGGGDELIDNGDGTQTVVGTVAGYDGDSDQYGGDTYRYSGVVTDFWSDGPMVVYLDGEETDPEDLLHPWTPDGEAGEYATDGVVDTAGLVAAIGDWRDGQISTSLLQDVIAAWKSGEPV